MLHILLMILKIVGIILAAILGILLSVFLFILFVPVRYRIIADGKLNTEEPIRAEIKITWLFHILNIRFSYPQAAYLRVRIFCFTIFDSSSAKTLIKTNRKTKGGESLEDTGTRESVSPEVTEDDKEARKEESKAETGTTDATAAEPSDTAADTTPDKSFFYTVNSKIRAFIEKLIAIFRNMQYTIQTFCDKIKKIIDNIEYYTEVLQSQVFKDAFSLSKKRIIRIFKSIRPRKCRINLIIGTGDPASTGNIYGIYGMLYPWIGNHIFMKADFENQTVEGDAYIKGKITAFTFIFTVLELYFNKNIRQLLKLLKKEAS